MNYRNYCSNQLSEFGLLVLLLVWRLQPSTAFAQGPAISAQTVPAGAQGAPIPAASNADLEALRNTVHNDEKEFVHTKTLLDTVKTEIPSLKSAQDTALDKIHENDKGILKIANEQDILANNAKVALIVIGIIGTAAYLQLRQWAKNSLSKKLERDFATAKAAVESDIDRKFSDTQKQFATDVKTQFTRFDQQVSDLVMLTQRAERKEFDAAIEAIGWDRRLESLRSYPTEIQKLIIQCALSGVSTPNEVRDVAWNAAEQIFARNKSEGNLSFLYEIAASSHAWDKGYDFNQRYGIDFPIKSNPRGLRFLLEILRRNLKFSEASQAADTYENSHGPMTMELVTLLGHLKNNTGDFEAANRLLEPEVEKILRAGRIDAPSRWEAVIYRYLLNCIAWGKPENGVRAAQFAVKMIGDSLLQLGVVRLALQLEATGNNTEIAQELINDVEFNLNRLPEDVMTLQIQARLMHRSGDTEGAINLLKGMEDRVRAGEVPNVDPERAEYFFSCLIGELLIQIGKFTEARDYLRVPSYKDRVGEARFLMALSYANQGHNEEATDFVCRAGMVHRRWCRIAQLKQIYPKLVESHQKLHRQFCEGVPESAALNAPANDKDS